MDTFIRVAGFLLLGGLVAGIVDSVFYGGSFLMPVLAMILVVWAVWWTCGDLPQ
ncbi:MAG: hypothetical protein GXY83_12055 [Rhodopirellula sp.]|nr:hypothetical protein [Rhodopirellula sp.]